METELHALFPHILPTTLDLYLTLALTKVLQTHCEAAENVGDFVIGQISLHPQCAGRSGTPQADSLKTATREYFMLNR